jgi:hypothetical protein
MLTFSIMEEHCYAECHIQAIYAQCRYAECYFAKCRGARFMPVSMILN